MSAGVTDLAVRASFNLVQLPIHNYPPPEEVSSMTIPVPT